MSDPNDDTGPAVGIVAAPEPAHRDPHDPLTWHLDDAPFTHEHARQMLVEVSLCGPMKSPREIAGLRQYITQQHARDAAREALERRAEEATVRANGLAVDVAMLRAAYAEAERERDEVRAAEPSSLAAAGWPWERRRALYLRHRRSPVSWTPSSRARWLLDVERSTANAHDETAVTAAMIAELERLAADCDDGNPCTEEDAP